MSKTITAATIHPELKGYPAGTYALSFFGEAEGTVSLSCGRTAAEVLVHDQDKAIEAGCDPSACEVQIILVDIDEDGEVSHYLVDSAKV